MTRLAFGAKCNGLTTPNECNPDGVAAPASAERLSRLPNAQPARTPFQESAPTPGGLQLLLKEHGLAFGNALVQVEQGGAQDSPGGQFARIQVKRRRRGSHMQELEGGYPVALEGLEVLA